MRKVAGFCIRTSIHFERIIPVIRVESPHSRSRPLASLATDGRSSTNLMAASPWGSVKRLSTIHASQARVTVVSRDATVRASSTSFGSYPGGVTCVLRSIHDREIRHLYRCCILESLSMLFVPVVRNAYFGHHGAPLDSFLPQFLFLIFQE